MNDYAYWQSKLYNGNKLTNTSILAFANFQLYSAENKTKSQYRLREWNINKQTADKICKVKTCFCISCGNQRSVMKIEIKYSTAKTNHVSFTGVSRHY